MGCAGKKNEATQATQAPAGNSSPGLASLDASLLNIRGEGLDEGSLPENGLPTPPIEYR